MEPFINIIVPIVLLLIGYTYGQQKEKRHYKSIRTREQKYSHLPALNIKKYPGAPESVLGCDLVIGSTVVSIDYFKRFVANLKMLVGGRLTSYESLVDRARREAILRMKEKVTNSNMIVNVRIETSAISSGTNNGKRQSVGSIEIVAYGTALTLKS